MEYHWEADKLKEYLGKLLKSSKIFIDVTSRKYSETDEKLDHIIHLNKTICENWWNSLDKDEKKYPINIKQQPSLNGLLIDASFRYLSENSNSRHSLFIDFHNYTHKRKIFKEYIKPHENITFSNDLQEYILVELDKDNKIFKEWVRLENIIKLVTGSYEHLLQCNENIMKANTVTLSDGDIQHIKTLLNHIK